MEAHSPHPAATEGLLEHLEHRLFKKPLWTYLRCVHPLVILTSPIIYLCAIPFFALDLAVTIYQAICFPVYGIAIKHVRPPLRPHSHYPTFVPYGDPRAYRKLVDRIAPAPRSA